jgi:hypothetical protein
VGRASESMWDKEGIGFWVLGSGKKVEFKVMGSFLASGPAPVAQQPDFYPPM